MTISDEAVEYMAKLGELYVAHKFADHLRFDAGKEDSVQHELRAAGLIKRFGTRGASWGFTPTGIQWVMSHRQAS